MKKIASLLCVLAIGVVTLQGCTTFGVDDDTWKTMSPKERQIAMNNYYQSQAQAQANQEEVDRINAQNAPLNNAVNALNSAAGGHGHKHDHHQHCITGDFGKTVCGYNCYKDDFGNPHCASS